MRFIIACRTSHIWLQAMFRCQGTAETRGLLRIVCLARLLRFGTALPVGLGWKKMKRHSLRCPLFWLPSGHLFEKL